MGRIIDRRPSPAFESLGGDSRLGAGTDNTRLTLSALEGPACLHDGGVVFGGTPRAQWAQWFKPDSDNLVELAGRVLLVQGRGKNTLVVAGSEALLAPPPLMGHGQERVPRGLLGSLAQVGLGEEDIHAVVLAHLRVGPSAQRLATAQQGSVPRILFPRARYIVCKRQWRRARHPHPGDRASFLPQVLAQLESSNRLDLLDDATSDFLGSDWCFHFSDGYTPGQLHPEIAMPGGPVLFAGDLVPARHWLQLPLTTGYDRNPELLIEEKERLLDYAVAKGCRLFFAHDPQIACASVMRDRQSQYVLHGCSPSLSGIAR
ncbi:MBL fold metallo-hydrolase [Pseudomonas sp. GM17]|uniref:MBL fold metallo-hydrolase n=1 Tax=Pseudomonas sp. GM17 TaxID=1144323 RepID=UPI0002725076|nr:MBL fold metallo-hydrolase [Pseudomonas sp. GM17]WIE48430.1 MBL fold metallo-hydrolase [Pseudomonas sp. GM17]